MSTAIADFREPVRAFLDDQHPVVKKYANDAIDSVIKTLLRCGKLTGYAVAANGTDITPNITTPRAYAILTYQACIAFAAPRSQEYSYKTRALAEKFGHNRDLLWHLYNELYEAQDSGVLKTWGDFATWALGVTGTNVWAHLTDMKVNAPVATVSIGVDGVRVNR